MTTTGRKPAGRARLSRRTMRDMLKPVGLEGAEPTGPDGAEPTGPDGAEAVRAADSAERVELPAVIGLSETGPLRQQLLGLRGRAVDLDGAGVERLGALGLQVLLSAQATWHADGQALRLRSPSESLLQGLAVMGATDLLSITPGADL